MLAAFKVVVVPNLGVSPLGCRPLQNIDLPSGIRAHKHPPLGIDCNPDGPEAAVWATSNILVRHDINQCRRARGWLHRLSVGEPDYPELVPDRWLAVP